MVDRYQMVTSTTGVEGLVQKLNELEENHRVIGTPFFTPDKEPMTGSGIWRCWVEFYEKHALFFGDPWATGKIEP